MAKVAVLKTKPETVLEDVARVMRMAGYREVLSADKETALKINISWHHWYPAVSTTPWQLEGTILALRQAGFADLVCVQNQTVVTNAFKGEDLNGYMPICQHYDVPVLYNFLKEDMTWVPYRPQAEMLALDNYIDLIIPRGSNEFVRYIMNNTNIPVLGHAEGICHVYVDAAADVDMAVNIAVDSKCQYVAVCNAAETMLVHAGIAEEFLPKVKAALEEKGVEIRGCEKTASIIDVKPATEECWSTEYLDLLTFEY